VVDIPSVSLLFLPWPEPADDTGFALRSDYVERFWLPLLGPTTTLLLRLVGEGFALSPQGFACPAVEVASRLGLGASQGRHSSLARSLARARFFGFMRSARNDRIHARRYLPRLDAHQVQRLTGSLQQEHRAWTTRSAPPVSMARGARYPSGRGGSPH
jgi:hypothetical protein